MSEKINLSQIPTDELFAEIFSRYEIILISLCGYKGQQGELQATHHYRGSLHVLISECELLKDEIMEGHRENLKKIRCNIPHPGGSAG